MRPRTLLFLCFLLILSLFVRMFARTHFAPRRDNSAWFLAKASAAFERNRQQEIHWNWVSKEKHAITGNSGKVVQPIPDVTIESVIRSDGKRCTAVRSWGDGVAAYLVDAAPDARSQATEDEKGVMEISALLKSRRVTFMSESAGAIKLSITSDKNGLRSTIPEERCAASIGATLLLDAETFFPRRIDGDVEGDGCIWRIPPASTTTAQ